MIVSDDGHSEKTRFIVFAALVMRMTYYKFYVRMDTQTYKIESTPNLMRREWKAVTNTMSQTQECFFPPLDLLSREAREATPS